MVKTVKSRVKVILVFMLLLGLFVTLGLLYQVDSKSLFCTPYFKKMFGDHVMVRGVNIRTCPDK